MLEHTEAVTDRFVRPAVDVDDTIPVALYTRPYDRLEIARPDSVGPRSTAAGGAEVSDASPRREIDARARRPPPTPIPRGLFVGVLLAAFGCGFGLVVLLLG